MIVQEKEGFDISLNQPEHLVKVALWGVWNSEIAKQFKHSFRQWLGRQSIQEEEGWNLLFDLMGFSNQTQEVQDILTDVLVFARQQGMKGKAVMSKKPIMPFQSEVFLHYPELKIHFFFHTEDDAVRWLRKSEVRTRSEKKSA